MRRSFLGYAAALAAAFTVGAVSIGHFARDAVMPAKIAMPARFRKKKRGQIPKRGDSHQDFDTLIVDRSSSFKKLRRIANAGKRPLRQPDARALTRHSWYRRKALQAIRQAAL